VMVACRRGRCVFSNRVGSRARSGEASLLFLGKQIFPEINVFGRYIFVHVIESANGHVNAGQDAGALRHGRKPTKAVIFDEAEEPAERRRRKTANQ
jgi:hypothetical protein